MIGSDDCLCRLLGLFRSAVQTGTRGHMTSLREPGPCAQNDIADITQPTAHRVFIHPPMRKVSFGKALRRYPRPRHASTLPLNPSVRVTTLPNKIRVATENTPGHFSSVGLYIDAGARYETPPSSGVSHFLDRMAFKVRFNSPPTGQRPRPPPS